MEGIRAKEGMEVVDYEGPNLYKIAFWILLGLIILIWFLRNYINWG